VLGEAVAAGGSSLRDFASPDGTLGYFSKSFAAYDREGEPCACGGRVKRIVQGGRSTIIPITVSGDVVGALVVGPMADEPGFSTIVKVRDLVNETASRLTEAWRTKR